MTFAAWRTPVPGRNVEQATLAERYSAPVPCSFPISTMSQASDVWYVRLPDGRVIRAKSTDSVRHHLGTGRIPRDSWVRRTQEEQWASLERVPEFADLARPRGTRGRPEGGPATPEPSSAPPWAPGPSLAAPPAAPGDDRMQLQTVGAGGRVKELVPARDSPLNRAKFRVPLLAALGGGVSLILARLFSPDLEEPLDWLVWAGAGLVI